jgi:hypothetical protein
VHEYQVDIKNYEAMRELIKSWIMDNSTRATVSKCAVDLNGSYIGKIESEDAETKDIVINGQLYRFLEMKKYDGDSFGVYIKDEDLKIAESMESLSEKETFLGSHSYMWVIKYYAIDLNNNKLGVFDEKQHMLINDEKIYYVAHYELIDGEYKDLCLLTEDSVWQLLMLYTKTYRLNNSQNASMQSVFYESGVMAVKTYINELFAEDEASQNNQETPPSTENETTPSN